MDKTTAMHFFAALQRLMKRHGVDEITAGPEGRVVFKGKDGKRMCGFESLDLSSETLSDCLIDAGWRDLK